jgi:hypothetical protein
VDWKIDLVNHISWSAPAGDSLQTKGLGMNAMAARENVTERRKDKRFRVKEGALAAVRPYLVDRNPIGSIVDISMSGLSFTYFTNGEMAHELPELDLCFKDDGFYLGKIPFRIVSDFGIDGPGSLSPNCMRRRGVKFGDLTERQSSLLESFIQTYAIGEV